MSTLQSMVEAAINGGTIRLPSDIEEAVTVPKGKNLIFDLNGRTWSAVAGATPLTVCDSTVRISNGTISSVNQPCVRVSTPDATIQTHVILDADVTLNGSGHSCVFISKYGNLDTAANMNATDGAYCIVGGDEEAHFDNNCTIRAGALTASGGSNGTVAVYWPQRGNLYITGGVISGDTAVEVRAGSVTVAGGSLKATYPTFSVQDNNDGQTTKGAALAICQHITGLPTTCVISGGIFSGDMAFFEGNPQNNPMDMISKVELLISGGNFQGKITSKDCTAFIEGGTFRLNAVAPELLKADIQHNSDGMYITYYVDPSTKAHIYISDLSVDGVISSTAQGVLMGMVKDLPGSAEIGTVLYSATDKQYHKWNGREWVVEDMAIADDTLVPGSTRPVQTKVVETVKEELQAQIDNMYTADEVDGLLDGKQNTVTGAAKTILNSKLPIGQILQSDNDGYVVASDYPITALNVLSGIESDKPIQEQLDEIKAMVTSKPLMFEDVRCYTWEENIGSGDYPHRGTIELTGVEATDYAQVAFSREDSLSGKFAPDCETDEGKIYIWTSDEKISLVTIPLIAVTKG